MSYNLKPALSIVEQVERLKQRDLIVEDDAEAICALQHLNYYRFSGYAFLFQKGNNRYQKGTTFRKILRLMEFDTALRRILAVPLEYIEIYARTKISYWFSTAHGRDGGAHYDATLFVNATYHAEYLDNLQTQMKRNRSQPFVAHHIQAYNGKMPLWCAVELLSFSTLSKLYSNMKKPDKDLIAANMNTDADHLTNWLHCFSVLRNACAHYNRLYRNVINPKASLDGKLLRRYPEIRQDSLFAYVVAMLRIMPGATEKTRLITTLKALFGQYPDAVRPDDVGFPDEWEAIVSNRANITLKPVSDEKKRPAVSMKDRKTEGETT